MNVTTGERILKLAYLDGRKPSSIQELEEALDQVLSCWSGYLADNEADRLDLIGVIGEIASPYLEAQNEPA